MNTRDALHEIERLSARFADEGSERRLRRHLAAEDFQRLREAGYLLTGVPAEQGGIWESVQASTRPVCEMLRVLARGDPSVALVASMHPAVLSFWLASPEAPQPFRRQWQEQRRWVVGTVLEGHWWGTITSEPGSGGDVARSKARAHLAAAEGRYRLWGQKHFGSGSGVMSFMITTAVPEGEEEPDWFFLDVRDAPWDGTAGVKLLAEWDGHGMAATQSHAFEFDGFPATRFAWPGHLRGMTTAAGAFVGACFTAVVTGVAETAMDTAERQLARRRASLRPFEQVEWTNARMEGWLIQQAYEGMLRRVEAQGQDALQDVLLAKTSIARLAESALLRLCRIVGGGTFSRQSPFGFWHEDVRALGFLRPPWGLAYDTLYEAGWSDGA